MFLPLGVFLLRSHSPGFLLSWPLLWVLAQELAGKPVGLTPKRWELTKLWSDLPPKSLHGRASSSDREDFDFLGSSAPFQMITLPQWADSGDLPLEPDQFPVPHQDLHDKVIHPGKLPEIVLRLNNIKNQASNLPLQFEDTYLPGPKSKIQASGYDQAPVHQAFEMPVPPERPSSKTTQFVPTLNWKKDLALHEGLAKAVVGASNPFVKAQLKMDAGQDGNDAAYSDSLPLRSQSSGEPSEPLKQVQPSQLQLETWTRTPPTRELVQSLSPQQEAPSQLPQLLDEVETPLPQEAPAQYALASEELAHALLDVKGSPPSRSEAQHPSSPPATETPVDIQVTMTSEAGKQAQQPPSQQQAPVQSPESPEEVKPPSTQQEPPSQPSELPEILEGSGSQLEAPGLPEESSQEVTPPLEEEDSALASESFVENVVETPTVQTPSQDQNKFPNTTAKPVDVGMTITSEPTRETDSSPVQQEAPAQPPGLPLEGEPSLSQEQESTGELESSGSHLESPDQSLEDAEEVDSDSESQLEAAALPEGKPPVEQEAPVQTPESPVESQNESHQYNVPSATVRPVDVTITITSATTPEGESSPAQLESPAEPPEEAEELEPPSAQGEPVTLPAEEPVTPPAEEPVTSPAEESVTPSAEESVTPPAEEPVTPPAEEPVTPPAEESVTPPAEEPVTSPAEEPVTPPAEESVTPPTEEPVTPPAEESVTPPAEESVTSPTEESVTPPAEEPVTPPAEEPVTPPVEESVTPPAEKPVTQTAENDSERPVTNPVLSNEYSLTPVGDNVPPSNNVGFTLLDLEMMFRAHHSRLPPTTVKHVDVEITITPDRTMDGGVSVPQEHLAKPVVPTWQAGFSPSYHDSSSQPTDFPVAESSPVQQEPVPVASEPPTGVNASTQQEIPGLPPAPTMEVRPSTAQQMTPSQPVERPENMRPSSVSQPSPAQPSEPPMDVEPAPTLQVVLPELPVPPPTHYGTTVPTPGEDQAPSLPSPSVTSQPLDLQVTINLEPTKEVQHSTALTKTASTPMHSEATPPDQVQDQHLNLPTLTLPPFDVELTVTDGSNTGTELTPTLQETLTEPPQTPVLNESTRAMPGQDQTQIPVSPTVPVQPLGQTLSVTPESWMGAQRSIALTRAITPSQENPEMTSPDETHANTNDNTSQMSRVEYSQTPQVAPVVQQPALVKNAPAQPPELRKNTAAQLPVLASSWGEAQNPVSPTPQAARSEAPQATAPPSKPSEMTSTDQGQIQSPNPAEVTASPLDLEAATQYSGGSQNYFPVSEKQILTTGTNLCKLCACQNETLSCVGLSPEQKLHQVPELDPNSYNGTFTILIFQGNKISNIDKSIWKEYPWTEQLILSDNQLTELHKDNFEGLLSLQFLDLSCNKIRYIERGTFDSLPFLKYINLGCNLMVEVSFGTFQAWHRLQFLYKIILNRNPLAVIEDPYLFTLPALKYLDMGKTHVQLKTVENILLMSLELEKLILPSHLSCCLCQLKSKIEAICKTVTLHCENGCQANTTHCFEGASSSSLEEAFLKALQSRKEATSTQLTIQPDGGEENSIEDTEKEEKRRQRRNRVHKTPRSTQKRHSKKARGKSHWRKPSAQPPEESAAVDQRQLRSPSSMELDMVQKPRKLVENSLTEPSLAREYAAAVSSSPAQFWISMASKSTPEKSLPDYINKRKELTDTIFVLEDASAKVRGMEDTEPVLKSDDKQQTFKKKKSHLHLMAAVRPPASAVRSLINSLPQEALSSSGDLSSLADPLPEIYAPSDPSTESTPVKNHAVRSTFEETLTTAAVLEETAPESTSLKNPDEGVTVNALDISPYQSNSSTTRQDLPVTVRLSAGDQFESELYQQMQPLIPDVNVRKLIAHVVRTLKMDCSEAHVQLPCVRLLSRTSHLMKLLTEHQGFTMAKADWDTEQWKTEDYLRESPEAQSGPKGRVPSEMEKEVSGHGYSSKLILAISMTAVVMVLVIIFCLIEIHSHRTARMYDEEKSSRGCFPFRRKRHTSERESQEDSYWLKWPLWLRDMYRPLHASRKKNMAKNLQDQDTSDDDELFVKDTEEFNEVTETSQAPSSADENNEGTTE